MNSLYMLDINPLSDISFANIFFHSVDCLFIFWWFPLLVRSFQVELGPICLFLLLFSLPDDTDPKDLLLRLMFLKKYNAYYEILMLLSFKMPKLLKQKN